MEEQAAVEEQETPAAQDPASSPGEGVPTDGGAVPEAPGEEEPDLKAERVQNE